MSRFRKPRPISREEQTYADDTLLVVACEDHYAPEQYFKLLPNQRVKVKTLPAVDDRSDPKSVLQRLDEFIREYDLQETDQLWLALDTDHWASGKHKRSLASVLQECQQRGIEVAMSNPCFDLWLLLHQTDIRPADPPRNAREVARRFRALKGEFNKKLLKPEHYPATSIVQAVKRAQALDLDPDNWFPVAPCSRIYRIVEQAVRKDFVRLDLGTS